MSALAGTFVLTGCLVDFSSRPAPDGATPVCGDGVLQDGESCDGSALGEATCLGATGRPQGALRCSPQCTLDVSGCYRCGDGVVEPAAEACDDGNEASGDGCAADCRVEPGWVCMGEPSLCGTRCGDGRIVGPEACDDGNEAGGDGCSSACQVESGWRCEGEPSRCARDCGDGVLQTGEACDDGNAVGGDGCSSACQVESGWRCDGQSPSTCSLLCGDGVLQAGEACDDGNLQAGDGCSSTCAVEDFFACDGAPSTCLCVVYVDKSPLWGQRTGASWEHALATVQGGVQVAGGLPGCEVWVAAGTYSQYRVGASDTLALASGVHLYGGFLGGETLRSQRAPGANLTVLDGSQPAQPGNRVHHVVTATNVTGAVLDGFYIRNGDARPLGIIGYGGGYLGEGGTVYLSRCVFEDNQATRGGGVYQQGGTLYLTRSTFEGNLAVHGGGAWLSDGAATVTGSTFQSNTASMAGGGLMLYRNTSPITVDGCRFFDNAADGGAGLEVNATDVTVTNAIVAFNDAATNGGGLAATGGGAQAVINCTFFQNSALQGTEIWASTEAAVTVANAILRGGAVNVIAAVSGGSVAVTYSHLSAATSGAGNSTAYPVLVAPFAYDFALQPSSSCIDSAQGTLAPAVDIDGIARYDDPAHANGGYGTPPYADRGAYEWHP